VDSAFKAARLALFMVFSIIQIFYSLLLILIMVILSILLIKVKFMSLAKIIGIFT